MRTPKKGDRCEFAQFSQKTYRRERLCEVRHLEGAPPGQLIPVKVKGGTDLMCSKHAPEFGLSVRKQKPKQVDAAQEVLL